MIYKQIGTTTNKLTKVHHKLSPFETIAMTPVEIIEDTENKENYKRYKATQFVSGEFSEEANQPIIRNNENLYYRDLILLFDYKVILINICITHNFNPVV